VTTDEAHEQEQALGYRHTGALCSFSRVRLFWGCRSVCVKVVLQDTLGVRNVLFAHKKRNIQYGQYFGRTLTLQKARYPLRLKNIPRQVSIHLRGSSGEKAHGDELHIFFLREIDAGRRLGGRTGKQVSATVFTPGGATHVFN
jgi:hypothetical protein